MPRARPFLAFIGQTNEVNLFRDNLDLPQAYACRSFFFEGTNIILLIGKRLFFLSNFVKK